MSCKPISTFTLSMARLAQLAGGSFADGVHTLDVEARDVNGSVSNDAAVRFVLDTTVAPPALALANDTGISNADRLTSDPTIQGGAADPNGIATLEAAFDLGTTPVFHDITGTLANGTFRLSPADLAALLGSPLSDGNDQLLVRAHDDAGNVSTSETSFTLDRTPPDITVTSPAPGLITQQNVTITGQVTDDRSGVATLEEAVDGGTFTPLSIDTHGSFSLTTALALDGSANGTHTVHLRSTDNAGNVSGVSDVSFDLESSNDPARDFSTFTPGQVGGSGPGVGTVQVDPSDGATLVEGNSFDVSLSKTLTIPAQPSDLVFSFSGPTFDTSSQGTIKDAFEVAFVDAGGRSLLQTIGSGQDAFFNVSEGQAAAMAAGVSLGNGTVTASLAGLQPGTTGTLIFRLVNNDRDTTTSVHLNSVQFQQSSDTTPPLSNHATRRRGGPFAG